MIPLPQRHNAIRPLSAYPEGARANENDADFLQMQDAAERICFSEKRGKRGLPVAQRRRDPGKTSRPAMPPMRGPNLVQFGRLYHGDMTLEGCRDLTPEKIFSYGKMKVSHRESVGLIRYHRGGR